MAIGSWCAISSSSVHGACNMKQRWFGWLTSVAMGFLLAAGSGPVGVAQEKDKGKDKDKEKKEEKVITTDSGLKYIDLKEGNGATAKKGDMVAVHYTGWLKNGKKFDSSLDRKQ